MRCCKLGSALVAENILALFYDFLFYFNDLSFALRPFCHFLNESQPKANSFTPKSKDIPKTNRRKVQTCFGSTLTSVYRKNEKVLPIINIWIFAPPTSPITAKSIHTRIITIIYWPALTHSRFFFPRRCGWWLGPWCCADFPRFFFIEN